MASSLPRKWICGIVAVATVFAVGLIAVRKFRTQPPITPSLQPTENPKPIVATESAPALEPAIEVSPADAAQRSREMAASVRMYEAHSSLRTAAVANPDSPENRKVLQTMVMKALESNKPQAVPAAKP